MDGASDSLGAPSVDTRVGGGGATGGKLWLAGAAGGGTDAP